MDEPTTVSGIPSDPAADVIGMLRLLLPELRERFRVESISVFGSQRSGDATPASDIDLLVTFRSGAGLFDLVALEQHLQGRFRRPVDVVTPSSLKPAIKDRILESAVPV